MCKLQHLENLLLDTHSNCIQLRWSLETLPEGHRLLAEISDFYQQTLITFVQRAIGEMNRRPRFLKPLLLLLRHAHPERYSDIETVADLWGIDLNLTTEPEPESVVQQPSGPSSSGQHPRGKTMSSPDVAVLIALREEFRVFRDVLATHLNAERDWKYGGFLYRFQVPGPSAPYTGIVLYIDDMGPEEATLAATRLLDHKPKVLVNLGIAGSLTDDLLLGDVAVANQVDAYLSKAKAVPDGEGDQVEFNLPKAKAVPGGWKFEFAGQAYRGAHQLIADASNLEFAHPEVFDAWQSSCTAALVTLVPDASKRGVNISANRLRTAPVPMITHLASGPAVAASDVFAQWVRSRDRKLGALEMEAAGMMLAAHKRAVPAQTLVLRGISDFCDSKKSAFDREGTGAFRKLAMGNAVRLLLAMMEAGLLPRG